jgi:uncharacterized protein YcbX
MIPSVESISIYPVKSTAGRPVRRARVEPRGLECDRRWMLVTPGGRFLSARKHPRLVTVTATLQGNGLVLEAPGHESLELANARGGDEELSVTIWNDRVRARAVDPCADRWFSELLSAPCRLVHMPPTRARAVDPEFARAGDEVSFADAYPLLLIGAASLHDLRARAPIAISMRRFRPNVTVAGSAAYAEDGWASVRIGDVEFDVAKPCERCVLTTVDPDTGEQHPGKEPLLTLSRYRRDPARGILFGVNLIPRGSGALHVGDSVEVLARSTPPSFAASTSRDELGL